jgi:membrane-bound lytic murein transglycosylase A
LIVPFPVVLAQSVMKRLLCFSVLSVLLAACSTTPHGPSLTQGLAPSERDTGVSGTQVIVPKLSSMPDTAPRTLAGKFQRANWADLSGFNEENPVQLWPLFLRNCRGLMRPVSGGLAVPARATPRAWQPFCAAAVDSSTAPAATDAQAVRRFLQTYLQPWRLATADGRAASNTVTGYYEPIVRGSREQGGAYQWPLYTVPADLLTIDLGSIYPELAGKRVRGKLEGKRVVPYDTRAALERSPNRPPVLVWIDNPVDAFFLQVQGSGRVRLTTGSDEGQTIRVAYADHNGQPYVSIGKWLADKGELTLAQASMQNIREWARKNPKRVPDLLNANPAVVFFREEQLSDNEQGPNGAYGLPLTATRAIAVDTGFVPLGAPVFLATTQPASDKPLDRLVFAQDTGAAIRGAARADFYWGAGDEAGQMAGRMKQRGTMWVLWPKQAGEPSAR